LKKLLKGLLLSVSVISFASSAWSAWWMYENNNYQLYSVAQPAKNISITKQDQKTEGVSYTSAVEITSPEQIEKARNDTSQPLYLRSFLSIPNLGINLQVFEGTSERVLTYGAGTIKPNQNPDSFGNYALAAHNFYDSSYGSGFSILQTSNNIVGSNAYLTDGDYVYTYRLAKVTQVYKDDSMVYTEDDFSEQVFSNEISQLAPENLTKDVTQNKIWNNDGTYTESVEGKNFKFGKLLTLYTCYLEPTNRTLSYDRIIVTGVQVKKEKISEAPKDVRDLFIDPNSNNQEPTVTGNSSVPKSEKEAVNTEQGNKDNSPQTLNFKTLDEGKDYKNIVEFFVLPHLRKDPNFIWKIFYVGLGSFVASSVALIFIPWKKKGNKKKTVKEEE
jgi:sortase srtA